MSILRSIADRLATLRRGRRTSSTALDRVVEEVTARLIGAAKGVANDLTEVPLPTPANSEIWTIRSECLLLFLHATDRIAFAVLGSDGRQSFMDRLVPEAIAVALLHLYPAQSPAEIPDGSGGDLFNRYGARQQEYSPYELTWGVRHGHRRLDSAFWYFLGHLPEFWQGKREDFEWIISMELSFVAGLKAVGARERLELLR